MDWICITWAIYLHIKGRGECSAFLLGTRGVHIKIVKGHGMYNIFFFTSLGRGQLPPSLLPPSDATDKAGGGKIS
jgi:hypothetical protein